MAEKYESEIYNDYIKGNYTCTFEDFLFDNYNLMEYYLEQSDGWADDLGNLIYRIHGSGLLKESKFASEINSIYKTLDA